LGGFHDLYSDGAIFFLPEFRQPGFQFLRERIALVNLPPATPLDVAPSEGDSRQLPHFLEDMARLLETPLPPTEFYAEFLQRVLAATGAVAGSVWGRDPQGNFPLHYQINVAEVGLDQAAHGRACHAEVLRHAAQRDRPLWVPPHSGPDLSAGEIKAANLSPYGLLLAPVLVDKEVAGLLEVWQPPHLDNQTRRGVARFLTEVAGFVAAYWHKTRWRQLQDQQQFWNKLEAYAREVHASLDPTEVAYLVANQGRLLLEADQVAVALRWGKTVKVEAVSGAAAVEKRSRLVQLMRQLLACVLDWGEKVVYAGSRDPALPPAVLQALDAYLAESGSKLLIVLPLRDERESAGEHRPIGPIGPIGLWRRSPGRSALLAECFGPALPPDQLESRLGVLAPHAAAALYNAVEHRRLPLGWLTRPLARAQDRLRGRGWVKPAAVLAVLLAILGALVFIPAPLRLDAGGQLVPTDRQVVYATLTGKIVEMKAQHGDWVEKGQELLFMEDLETQLKIEQLGLKVTAAEQRVALLTEQLGKATGREERNALTRERIDQEYEMRKAMVEREILLQGSRSPRKAPVAAPLAGKVVTFDAREQLVGKTVKPGDPLLRIARVRGPWEVELNIPEGHLGPIREGLRRAPGGFLEVDLLLTSHPNQTFRGRLDADGLGGETVVKDNNVVLPARVRITDRDLLAQLKTLPVGVEVRAKVHCGYRALGYVWFFDLLEFFYEHVWF
jgi:multidrug efflux pump subunit AcrA (membrane-fusion protein)